jgi:hypothetical protein
MLGVSRLVIAPGGFKSHAHDNKAMDQAVGKGRGERQYREYAPPQGVQTPLVIQTPTLQAAALNL